MLKSFKHRIFPTGKQQRLLNNTLEECRWLYNHFLEKRKEAWEQETKSLNYHSQAVSIVALKKERPSLWMVYSQVLQNTAIRIDLAFKAFFRRIKAGEEKVGYPRFKGQDRYDSFTFPQNGFKITDNGIQLSKIGTVKIRLHRQPEGTIKTCTVRKTATGKWFVCFSCITEPKPLPLSDRSIGIDVGLNSFATFSNGDTLAHPRFFRKEEKVIAKAQRKLNGADIDRKKRRKVVSRIYERIANRRSDFTHQASRKIVNQYGIICIEDLSVNRMVHNHCLAKSIHDAAWSQFFHCLTYKAEYAGRRLVKVNPAYTSQDCSRCGHRQPMPLSDRIYSCPCCGIHLDRDHNAALNIFALGTHSIGIQSVEVPTVR